LIQISCISQWLAVLDPLTHALQCIVTYQHAYCRIFAGGMPFSYEEDAVREYWTFCGPIEDLSLVRFPDTGRFKGMAFITYATEEGFEAALACDGTDLDGKTLRVG
jgi:RNA recognition motif-containing protein